MNPKIAQLNINGTVIDDPKVLEIIKSLNNKSTGPSSIL